jgi:hypothetical protein
MADNQTEQSLHTIRRKTAALEFTAYKMGDPFLQALYAAARLHLEERLGIKRGRQRRVPVADAVTIEHLVARLAEAAGAELPEEYR